MKMEPTIFLMFIFISLITAQSNTYIAAVVEYSSKRNPRLIPSEVMQENVNEYRKLIEEAASQLADIIIFPEYGLTTLEPSNKIPDHLHSYGVIVPDPEILFNPCNNRSLNSILNDLSCAARDHKIYTVVNLVEEVIVNNSNSQFYNSEVVFDRLGNIIARQRKINLLHEPYFTSGNKNIVFKTDFGVTFGLLVGIDILYQNPEMNIPGNNEFTDVIFSSAWFSESPSLSALSVQAGYAIGNGVNLLASGYNDPSKGNGGSGIYLANGTIVETYISDIKTTKLLIGKVPKNSRKGVPNCKIIRHVTSSKTINGADINKLKTITNLKNYTYYPLNKTEVKSGSFLCKIDVDFENNPSDSNNLFEYKIAMFYGVRKYEEKTVDVRTCIIVACYNETCGIIPREVIPRKIKNISIISTFTKNGDEFIQPSSLTTKLTSVIDYDFCVDKNNDIVTVNISSNAIQDSLISLGFYNRVNVLDGNEKIGVVVDDDDGTGNSTDTIQIKNNDSDENNVVDYNTIIIVVVVTVFLILIVGGVIYIFYKRGLLHRSAESYRNKEDL